MIVEKIFVLLGIGLLTGTVTAMSAGSGVMIVVPLLVLVLGYTIHQGIGISLLVDVIASLNVAYHYYRYDRVDIRSGAWLAGGAVVGAQIGSHLANLIPQQGLTGGFSIFVVITGLIFWLRALTEKKFSLSFLRSTNTKKKIFITLVIGLGIGLMTGLFGAGGGVTILLVLVYVLDFPLHTALGTATAIMAITATSGVIGYSINGHIPWVEGIVIGLAAMVSGMYFTKVANRISEKALNQVVGSIFILVGILMTFLGNGGGSILAQLGLTS